MARRENRRRDGLRVVGWAFARWPGYEGRRQRARERVDEILAAKDAAQARGRGEDERKP